MGTDGFVKVVRGRAGDGVALREGWDKWLAGLPSGFLGATAGIADDGTFVGMARFSAPVTVGVDDVVRHLAGDAVVHDCPRTDTWNRGGSDGAGFVQIREGVSSDPARLRDLYVNEQPVRMGPYRPEVIGGQFAWHGERGFTLSAYFTSEAAARSGENLDAFRSFFDDISAVMQDVSYFDLHDPWLT